jgi:hypothetical protein
MVLLAAAAAAAAALPAALLLPAPRAPPPARGGRCVHWRGARQRLRQAAKVQVRLLHGPHAALQLAQLQALAQGLEAAAGAGAAQPRCRQRVPRAPQRRAQPSAVRVQRSQLALGQRQLLGGGGVGLCCWGVRGVAAC